MSEVNVIIDNTPPDKPRDKTEDYRATLLYKNAKGAMDSIAATNARIDDLIDERNKDRQQRMMLEQELRILTQRFNEQFIKLVGNGATHGDLD